MRVPRVVVPVLICVLILLVSGTSARGSQVPEHPNQTPSAKLAGQRSSQKPYVSFGKAVAYDARGVGADSVAVGDVNGDGILDIVVANECTNPNKFGCSGPGAVSVLLGKGDGTYKPAVSYAANGWVTLSVAIADLNGDGRLDIVVVDEWQNTSKNGAAGVLLGNGDGTFQTAVIYDSGGIGASTVAIGDLNADGHPDLIVTNSCQIVNQDRCAGPGTISVLLGKGDGTFNTPVSYDSGGYDAHSIAIGDVNGDSILDLVVTNFCQSIDCSAPGPAGILLGNGDGTFQPAIEYNQNGAIFAVAIKDVNGDGYADLVAIAGCSSCITVSLGLGDGTFQPALTFGSGGYGPKSIGIGDVNNDGKLDLVVANTCKQPTPTGGCSGPGTIGVLLGNGDGSFDSPVSYSTRQYDAESVALGDLNGDGKLDLVSANFCGSTSNCWKKSSVSVLLNAAKTTTSLKSSLNPSEVNQSVTFTATISSTPPIPDGEVVFFYDGAIQIGSATTAGGVATFPTSFSEATTHIIKANYLGDSFHKASSGTVKQVVNP